MLASFWKAREKRKMKEEKPVSIRSCRDDAQLSFRPTTTDKNPINLGLEKKNLSGWARQVAARYQGRASRSCEQVFFGDLAHTQMTFFRFVFSPLGGQPGDRKNLREKEFLIKAEKGDFFRQSLKKWTRVIQPLFLQETKVTNNRQKKSCVSLSQDFAFEMYVERRMREQRRRERH